MKFAEIRNDYLCDTFTPEEGDIVASISIDTWMTDNDNEEGKVVAKVIKTKSGDIATIYIDNSVRMNKDVNVAINEAIEQLENF